MYVETIVAFLNDCMFGSKRRKEIPTYFSGIVNDIKDLSGEIKHA